MMRKRRRPIGRCSGRARRSLLRSCFRPLLVKGRPASATPVRPSKASAVRASTADMGDTPIAIELMLPVDSTRVFRAWTEPRALESWVWGGIGTHPAADVDLRVGGR